MELSTKDHLYQILGRLQKPLRNPRTYSKDLEDPLWRDPTPLINGIHHRPCQQPGRQIANVRNVLYLSAIPLIHLQIPFLRYGNPLSLQRRMLRHLNLTIWVVEVARPACDLLAQLLESGLQPPSQFQKNLTMTQSTRAVTTEGRDQSKNQISLGFRRRKGRNLASIAVIVARILFLVNVTTVQVWPPGELRQFRILLHHPRLDPSSLRHPSMMITVMSDPKHNTLPTVINPLHYQLVHDQQNTIGTCPIPLLEHGQLHIPFHMEKTGTTRPLLHTVIIILINIVLLLQIPLALGREASRPSIRSLTRTIRMHAGTENVSDNTLLYRRHALHILPRHRQPPERDQENICTTILSMTARDWTGIGLRMNQITVRCVLARARILRGRRGMKLKEIDAMTITLLAVIMVVPQPPSP